MVHPAISSINLTTALGSLATIARQRPMFMSEVVQAYETLHGEALFHFSPVRSSYLNLGAPASVRQNKAPKPNR